MHDLLSKCADEDDATCDTAECLRVLAVNFLQSHEAMKKKLDGLPAKHDNGEAATNLVEAVNRVRRLFRCLSHLLSATEVGEPTTASEVLWFAEYQGRAAFEKGFKAALRDKKKAAGTSTEKKGMWQRLIDEAVCKAASSLQLRPTYKRVEEELNCEGMFEDCSKVEFVVESLSKLRAGMREADVEKLMSHALQKFKDKAADVQLKDVANVRMALVEALKGGLAGFSNEPGALECLNGLEAWITENIHAISAMRFVEFVEKVHSSGKMDDSEMQTVLKRCKRGKMSDDSVAKMPPFTNDCYSIILAKVEKEEATLPEVSKTLALLDKAVNLHFSDNHFVKRWTVAVTGLIKVGVEAVEGMDQLTKMGSTADVRLRKDKDLKLLSKLTQCLKGLEDKQQEVGKLRADQDSETPSCQAMCELKLAVFLGIDENEVYQGCLGHKIAALTQAVETKAAECLLLGSTFEAEGEKDWKADVEEAATVEDLSKITEHSLKQLPTQAIKSACEGLSQECPLCQFAVLW